jgi:thioredoxin reductase
MKLSRRQMLAFTGLLPFVEVKDSLVEVAQKDSAKDKIMKDNKNIYDCIIVGGGSAGLSAALTLGRARRKVLVCDKGNPRNTPAHKAHSFFTRDGTNPLELLRIGREQLKPYKTVEFQAVGVKKIKKIGDQFEVFFDDGATKNVRKVLLAFGVKDEFPDIENFGEFWGKTVFHCPFCHGFEVRDQPLAVVGNGEAGVGMVALLKSWSTDLVLCTNGKAELSVEQRKLIAKHNVSVYEEKIARFEGTDGKLENIVFETGEKLARDGMLIRLKQNLRSDLAQQLGCELSESGHIKVFDFNQTSVKGVYAAGDVTSPMQSIAVAVSQGAIAAGPGINHALTQENFA